MDTLPTTPTPGTSTTDDFIQRAAIDRSLKKPVLFYFFSASLWLVVATVLALFANIKLHSPQFLEYDWLSYLNYPRVQAASTSAFIYGWCFQVGMAVSLWLMGRLTRVPLKNTGFMGNGILFFSGMIWNLALSLGMLLIILGQGTSLKWLEFPRFISPVLLLCFLPIALNLVKMNQLKRGEVYITQKYLLASVFWFPWIFTTAMVLLQFFPGGGVAAAATNSWYTGTLVMLYFVPVGLASIYYFIPKIIGRPIVSYQLANWGFWGLAILGPWVGLQKYIGGPLPPFLPAISGAAVIFMLLPVAAVAMNHHLTTKGRAGAVQYSPTLRFTIFGAASYTAMSLLAALLVIPALSRFTQFSHAETGFDMMALYCFFSFAMIGAIYFIIPRLTGCEWLSSNFIRLHFWFSTYGLIAIVALSLIGGFYQGESLNNPKNWDLGVVASVVNSNGYVIGRTLAWSMILFSNMVFLLHITLMVLGLGRRSMEPTLLHHGHDEATHGDEQAAANLLNEAHA